MAGLWRLAFRSTALPRGCTPTTRLLGGGGGNAKAMVSAMKLTTCATIAECGDDDADDQNKIMDAEEAHAVGNLVVEGVGVRALVEAAGVLVALLLGCACCCFCGPRQCLLACTCNRLRQRHSHNAQQAQHNALIKHELAPLAFDEQAESGPRCKQSPLHHQKRGRQRGGGPLAGIAAAVSLAAFGWLFALAPFFAPWHACPDATTVSLDVSLHVVSPFARLVAMACRIFYRSIPFKVNGLAIDVAYPPLPVADVFEVQLAHAASPTMPFVAQLCALEARTCAVHDLLPASSYVVYVRQRVGGHWTGPTAGVQCTTRPLASRQLRIRPPAVEPTAHSVSVAVELHGEATTQRFAGRVAVQYRPLRNQPRAWSARMELDASPTAEVSPPAVVALVSLGGLAPGTTYEVRASALYRTDNGGGRAMMGSPRLDSPFSDPVIHRTASVTGGPSIEPLEVYRVSELCGMDAELPLRAFGPLHVTPRIFSRCRSEPMANVNAASLFATAALLARFGTARPRETDEREAVARRFSPVFNSSVLTRACLSRKADPFAAYVGCNGPDTQHYVCGPCYNLVDRCIGQLSVDECQLNHILDGCACKSLPSRGSHNAHSPTVSSADE